MDALPTPTAGEGDLPSLIPGASPLLVQGATEEQIHRFWSHIIDLSCVEFIEENEWSSVASMTQDVEWVVIARPQSVSYTPDDAEYHDSPIVAFAVDDVLKGDPAAMPDGTFLLYDDQDELETIDQLPVPDVPTLLFMRNMAVGRADWQMAGAANFYYLPTTYQNVMVEVGGRVFLPMEARMRDWLGNQTWPLQLQGASFGKVVDQVRNAVIHPGTPDGTTSGRSFAC